MVRVAFGGFFAVLFVEDGGGVGEGGREDGLGAVEDALGSGGPDGRGGAVGGVGGGGGYVGHDGGAVEHCGDVVGPLVADDTGAVACVVGAVVDVVVGAVY